MPTLGPQLPDEAQHVSLPSKMQHSLTGHDGPVLAVRFNKSGTYCLSAGRVSNQIFLQSYFCHCILSAAAHDGPVLAVRFNKSDAYCVSADWQS